MSLAELIRRAKADGDPFQLAEYVPYARFLGISAELVDGGLEGRLNYSDRLIGNSALPALHGGTIGALLETTAILEVMWDAEPDSVPKTINITVDYLRSGKPVDVHASGVITKHGRRVVNVRVRAWQDDPAKPIALANAHFLVRPAGDPASQT